MYLLGSLHVASLLNLRSSSAFVQKLLLDYSINCVIINENLLQLEKAVQYDLRSRIRAQIRLVKRQLETSKTSRTPSPEKLSPTRKTKVPSTPIIKCSLAKVIYSN